MSTITGANTGAGKPGPDLGPITETVTAAHRAWLEVMRAAYFDSGLSTEEISEKSRGAEGVKQLASKGKVSELLRGVTQYPRWYRVLALYKVLSPSEPLQDIKEMWVKGAVDAGRSLAWVNGCFSDVIRDTGTSGTDGRPIRLAHNSRVKPQPLNKGVVGAIVSTLLAFCSLFALWDYNSPINAYNPAEPHYLDLPTPSETRGLLKVTSRADIRAYARTPSGLDFEDWIEAGDTFFLKCRTNTGLLRIAETRYFVEASAVTGLGNATRTDIEDLPRCSTETDNGLYLDLPTPTRTQGLLKVVPYAAMPASSRTSDPSEVWIRAGDTFFLKCRADSYRLQLAGTRYYVTRDDVLMYISPSSQSWKAIEGLPRCTPFPETSPSAG